MKYLFTSLVSIVILIAVLIPGSNIPEEPFFGFDKFVHIGMFGTWALTVYYEFNRPNLNLFIAFVAGISFSLFTEILQLFVEDRSFDVYDLFADAAGLIIGLTVSPYILKFLKR